MKKKSPSNFYYIVLPFLPRKNIDVEWKLWGFQTQLLFFFLLFFWQDSNHEKGFRYEVAFDNITSKEDEYTVTISTELNGRTVTQTVEKFPMGQPDPWMHEESFK